MPSIINALTASGGGVAISGDATGNLALQTAGNTAVTVTTGQNVGIGTTNPAAVTGFTTSRRVLQVTNSGYGQLILGGSSGTMIDHDDDGNTTTTIRNRYGATSASALTQIQSGYITFGTGTSYTERMRITSDGFVKASNNGSYFNSSGTYHEFKTTLSDPVIFATATDASYGSNALILDVTRSASSANTFGLFRSRDYCA